MRGSKGGAYDYMQSVIHYIRNINIRASFFVVISKHKR